MVIEAGLWVTLGVLAPALAAWVWPRLAARLGSWTEPIAQAAPWLHSLVPGYLALLSGAVLGRDFGLYGMAGDEWLGGAVVCAGVLLAAAWLSRRSWLPEAVPVPDAASGLRAEVRWGFYRAAGVLWAGSIPGGTTIGFALAALEWGLYRPLRKGFEWRSPAVWLPLVRMTSSAVLFLVTHNFWLTAFTQVGLLLAVRRPAGAASRGPGPDTPQREA